MMNTLKVFFTIFSLSFLISCKENKKEITVASETAESDYYTEAYRPQFHFTPEEKWMNDPNGMVYHKGVYHLFYQYYPEDIVWGPMHWGHATSKDLVSWEHKPIALYPDEYGLIFSGSVVVDFNNTSGFGTAENPPLVAIYTYHLMAGEKAGRKDFQTQGIAYSLDNGDTWEKYEGNPVIGNDGIKDFRDPKVFWDDKSKQWIMSLVAGDHLQLWGSPDLKKWSKLSEFGKYKGAHGGVWECPDLFPLKVEGSDEEKWVLLISINPGAPNGGSGTQYFVGDFDGEKFSTDQTDIKWLDWGTDNYAGVTYSNAPNDEQIFIGWMSNWSYARDTPTEKWRSAMTVPRELSLKKIDEDYYLFNYPIKNLNNIIDDSISVDVVLPEENQKSFQHDSFNQTEIRFTTSLKDFTLNFKNKLGEAIVLGMSEAQELFILGRASSGKVDFQKDFGLGTQKMPIPDLPKKFEVRILMDASSIEVFINEGQYVMTAQIFPNETYTELAVINSSKQVLQLSDLKISKVDRIW